MAADVNYENQLFRHSDGTEMVFFMRPCNERQVLKPIIEKGGGKVTSKVVQNCIKLAEKGSLVSSEGYFSTKFVEDSAANGKLMDLEKYKITSGTRVQHSSEESQDSHLSFDSNDSLSPADYVKPLQNKDLKGRNKYTLQEDVAMMKYLIDTCSYTNASGTRVWKDMETMKVTSHTAQSMSARFRKTIVPNIEKYKDHIEKHWIPRLTGSLHQSASSSPEFSADALFQKRPARQCQPDSTTVSSKEKKAVSHSQHKMASLQQKDILEMFEGDDKTTAADTAQRKRALVPLEIISNLKRQKIQAPSDTEQTTENSKACASADRQEEKGEKKSSKISAKAVLKSDTGKAAYTAEHVANNDNNDGTTDEIEDVQICVLEDGRLIKEGDDGLPNASAILEEEQNTSIETPDGDNSGFLEELLSLAKTKQTKDKSGAETKTKSSKQCRSVDSYVTANSKPNTVKVVPNAVNNSDCDSLDIDIASSTSAVYLSADEETQEPDSQGVQNAVEILTDVSDEEKDSFDEMLVQCVAVVEKENSGVVEKKQNSTNKGPDKETDGTVRTNKGKELAAHRSTSTQPGSSNNALEGSQGKESQIHKREVDSCVKVCKTIGAALGLNAAFVSQVLYQCSGDPVRLEAYLKYGPRSKELPPWTSKDDEVLQYNRDNRKLRKQFGERDMKDRYQFLTDK